MLFSIMLIMTLSKSRLMASSKCWINEQITHKLILNFLIFNFLINSKHSHIYEQIVYIFWSYLVTIQKHFTEIFALLIYDLLFPLSTEIPEVTEKHWEDRISSTLFIEQDWVWNSIVEVGSSSSCVRSSKCGFIFCLPYQTYTW